MNFEDEDFELKEVQRLEGHTGRVWCLAWKPTAGVEGVPAVLASCGVDKTVRIWKQNSVTGSFQCKAVLEGVHTKTVKTCSWSPSGKLLATASYDATAALWEEDAGGNLVFVTTVKDHDNEVKSVAWSFCGTFLATCGRDKSVLVTEVVTPDDDEVQKPTCLTWVSELEGHKQEVEMVQWHPLMHTLFSCSQDNTIKVWTIDSGEEWYCAQTLDQSSSGHKSTVMALSINDTGDKMVSCSADLTIKIWDYDITTALDDYPDHWKHLRTLSGYHDRTIFSVHWSREGIISTGAGDAAICLFVDNTDRSVEEEVEEEVDEEVEEEVEEEVDEEVEEEVDGPTYRFLLKKEKAHDEDVNAVQWSPTENRRLASASDDGTIKIWELVSSPRKKNLVVS